MQTLALAVTYVVLARIGLALDAVGGFATLVWPPSGVAIAALLLGGYRLWPGVALGAFLANLWQGGPLLVSCGIAAGNTLEAVAGTMALRRIPGFRDALDRFTDMVVLVVLAVLASTLVSATLGTASLSLGGVIPAGQIPHVWRAWWMGDVFGVLLVTPVVLTWARSVSIPARPARVVEAIALGAVLIAMSMLLFGPRPEAIAASPFLQSAPLFIPMIWAALRFGVRGAATGMLVMAVPAIWGTYTGHGPYVRATRAESLAALQVALGTVSLAMLSLGSVVSDRQRSWSALNELLAQEQAARAEAQAATRARDELFAIVSHELRTPLQAMLGWTQMLGAPGIDTRTQEKGLATIQRSVAAQARLIEDLLDVSRIAAGKLRLSLQPLDLAEVVERAVESARAVAGAKSIQVDATLEPRACQVVGDPGRLPQVVSNLLANAVKFTPEGGRVGVRLQHAGARASLVVEDTGRGIPAELLPRIFDRFVQAGASGAQGGLGLGLAIVRDLVEMHGGTVKAESPGEGSGATFTVTLPLADDAPAG